MRIATTFAAVATAMTAAFMLSAPLTVSAQDWRGQRDRGNWNENGPGQQRDWRGDRGDRGERRHDHERRVRRSHDYDYARQRAGYGNGDYAQRGPVYQQRPNYQQRPIIVQRPVVVQRPQVVYSQGYGYPAYGPGYGYSNRPWQVGGYYYGNGYAPTYVVNDYNNYGLYAPPRGYSWRRDDFGNYLLVAIATGIITQLILGH